MSQLLALVTQIHGNEGVTDINYGTLWMTEQFVADADPQNILQVADCRCAQILYTARLKIRGRCSKKA